MVRIGRREFLKTAAGFVAGGTISAIAAPILRSKQRTQKMQPTERKTKKGEKIV